MLKGLRWPLLALILSGGLLVAAWLTRPDESSSDTTPQPVTATSQPTDEPAPLTNPEPVIVSTPLPPAAISAPLENILVEAVVGQIVKLNPLLATYNPVDRDITSLIFEGLTTTNDYGEIIPDLAESWTVSTDGLQYVFVLRGDILWQDGLPFTAHDVAYTITLISDPLFPGAEPLREFWRTVEVDALSDTLVRFRLTQPLASFPDQLRIGIVPAHVLEGTPVDQLGQHPFNLSPIGTGPYQIETLTASNGQIDGIQLRVAPVYRQRPEGAQGYTLDRVIFRTYPTLDAAFEAFQRGEVNSISAITPDQQAVARQIPGLSLYTTVQPHVGIVIYNWQNEHTRFVRNPRVRLALAQAVNRVDLVTRHLAGRAIPADSPLIAGSWAYVAGLAWPAYDPAGARTQIEASAAAFATPAPAETPTTMPDGATPTPDPAATPTEIPTATPEPAAPPADLVILVVDDPALVALATDVAAAWNQIGLKAGIETVDAAALLVRLQAGDFDAALVEFSFEPNADPDSFVFWHQGQYQAGQNYGGMDDRRISEALEGARRDPNGLNRMAYYRRFQELFAERAPALVLYYPLYMYAVDARLHGVQLGFMSSPSDRFRSIHDWAFSE